MGDGFALGEHRLLGQVPLVDLADPLLRPDDPVGEHGEREEDRGEDDDEGGGEIGCDRVVGAALHVPEGPVGRCDPEDHPVDGQELEAELDDRVVEDGADRVSDRREDLVHQPRRRLRPGHVRDQGSRNRGSVAGAFLASA